MELKDYQRSVLEQLERHLTLLHAKQLECQAQVEVLTKAGLTPQPDIADFATAAWEAHSEDLPRLRNTQGSLMLPTHVPRVDVRKHSIPNLCLKVPTGGGKTLLAVHSVEAVQRLFLRRQTGLVLWLVPSKTIYQQTWKQLANRQHPYRQLLERASAGRVKLLEKDDRLARMDVEHHLCVMLVILVATGRKDDHDFLKIVRDTGNYPGFFPALDDYYENNHLLAEHSDLQTLDVSDASPLAGMAIKHSLQNVLKLTRPLVVIDEGHRAYQDERRNTLNAFNPRFILELSATPNAKTHISNVLVDISGLALRAAQMIKLPIRVHNLTHAQASTSKSRIPLTNWQQTLHRASEKLKELQQTAMLLERETSRYIRPIMLIRVERTGADQRDGQHIHALDVRDTCVQQLGLPPEAVRIKSSSIDELGDEDLLSPQSPVQAIITKEALREGWDCPFAYVLVLLDNTKAEVALTQMVGRILRQPQARAVPAEFGSLNQCYIYCYEQGVGEAVRGIRQGLQKEGLNGLENLVQSGTPDAPNGSQRVKRKITIKRRQPFRCDNIFLPQVLHVDEAGGWRPLNYHQDILAAVDWEGLHYAGAKTLQGMDSLEDRVTTIDVQKKEQLPMFRFVAGGEEFSADTTVHALPEDSQTSHVSFFCRRLADVIPNPWQAARIAQDTLHQLRSSGETPQALYQKRLRILEALYANLKMEIERASETIFKEKLRQNHIRFQLTVSQNKTLNIQLLEELEKTLEAGKRALNVHKSLYEIIYQEEVNGFEHDVALYLDREDQVYWWHRLAVGEGGYPLQGWKRNKVYPDFLVCLCARRGSQKKLLVLETKGAHLMGNPDTEYKQQLLALLEAAYQKSQKVGGLDVLQIPNRRMVFRMLFQQDDWKNSVARYFAE